MEDLNIFIDKKKIDDLFNQEKYKNCMDKKYFEYIVSKGKLKYIDKYLKYSKNRQIIESLVFKNKVLNVIDKLSVRLENQRFIGELESSGIDNIEISKEIVNDYHNKILTNGIFALVTLEENTDKKYQYYIEKIEILEDVDVSLDEYIMNFSDRVRKYRRKGERYIPLDEDKIKKFDEISEIDLVLNTIGISAKELTFWEKILFLVRLIPLCEANYNLMELGGNGIGKTKTYTMFSPECEIVQEMLVTEIIYNKRFKIKGLLDTKNVIVFDEVNKIKIDSNNEKIIPQLLNFMADGQTTSPRKVISKTSLVFSGNVMGIQERIEKNEKNIFDDSHKFEDNAFLDRIHFFLPAWGLRRYSKNVHGLDISKNIFRFDYFSKALSLLRSEDYSKILDERGYVIYNGSEREVRAIRKTVSGLIKLTHPDKFIDNITIEAYIAIAIKGRGLINKFLNNKHKNNVGEINVKVTRMEYINTEFESIINESLKNLINKNNSMELSTYLNEYNNNIFNVTYSQVLNQPGYSQFILDLSMRDIENNTFYTGKFYPNRQIIVFDNRKNNGNLVFIKIALDKMGIEKNRREYKKIGSKNNLINAELSGIDAKILILKMNQQSYLNIIYDHTEVEIKYLNSKSELNYDGLFGGTALDYNEFSELKMRDGNTFELDVSNSFEIDSTKRIRCVHCKEEIVPKYMSNGTTGNYYYECNNVPEGDPPYKSSPMNYVEFKYFLRDNGVIKF